MRLLYIQDNGSLCITQGLIQDIPPYTILSHTWEKDQEVTLKELETGMGRHKRGYDKIRFCGRLSARDKIQYFWVDTCCTIQTHHRRQCPTKMVVYAAGSGGRMYIVFQYKSSIISLLSYLVVQSLEKT
jgi:heterokaryon incompatibility protein (HET)